MGIVGCLNQCRRTHFSTAKQEVVDIFVCGNTALRCSIYVTGTGTILGLKGFGIVVTGRRMPAREVPDPNRLLGNISIALCLLLISFLSFWLVLTWNCSVTVCNKEPLQRHACIFRLGVGEGI